MSPAAYSTLGLALWVASLLADRHGANRIIGTLLLLAALLAFALAILGLT